MDSNIFIVHQNLDVKKISVKKLLLFLLAECLFACLPIHKNNITVLFELLSFIIRLPSHFCGK